MTVSIPHLHLLQILWLTLFPYWCQLVAQMICTCTGLCSLQVCHRLGLSVKSIQLRVRAQHVVILIDCFWGDQEAPLLIGIKLVEAVVRRNDQIFLQNLLGVAANVNSCLDASATIRTITWLLWLHPRLNRSDLKDLKESDFSNSSLRWQKMLAKVGFSSIYNQFSACRCNVLLALNMYICISY